MTSPTSSQEEQLLDGLVQLRFSDEADALNNLNAADLAEVLQGLVELSGHMAKAGLYGAGLPPQLRVRPPREGSFIVEAVLTFATDNPWAATGVGVAASAAAAKIGETVVETAGEALTQAMKVAARTLRGGAPRDFEHLDNGNVKVVWDDDSVNELPQKVWKELNEKKATRRAMRKILAPLGDEVNTLEVRGAEASRGTGQMLETPPDVVLDRTDYRVAVAVDPEPDDVTTLLDIEAQMLNVDFRRGQKWRIATNQGTKRIERSATMEDEAFQQALDDGRALRKNDILRLQVRETARVKNGRSHRDWAIVKVLSQRRGGGDDDGETSSISTS